MKLLKEDGSLNIEYLSKLSPGKFMEVCPQLTDEQMKEFRTLLAERISRYSGYTMNSLVVHHPDLAQKIMRHLICITGMMGENFHPFMVIFTEIEKAFNDIVEHQDALDITMRIYLKLRKLIG